MLGGLCSHVCVDSFTNSYMSLICQISTPSEVTWRGVLSPNIPNSATCDVKNSLFYSTTRANETHRSSGLRASSHQSSHSSKAAASLTHLKYTTVMFYMTTATVSTWRLALRIPRVK